MVEDHILRNAESLKGILEWQATGAQATSGQDYSSLVHGNERAYERIRRELLAEQKLAEILPEFIRNCRNLGDFWDFIKEKFPSYKERRTFIRNELNPLFDVLETKPSAHPCDDQLSRILYGVNVSSIKDDWQKALSRRDIDPDGAITSARTLLEDTIKYILDDMNIAYDPSSKLPPLYDLLSRKLDIAPNQTAERELKSIFGGCSTIVKGLGSLRNELGDAHGKGPHDYKISDIYSQLAVNLAGTMACFLIMRWNEIKPTATSNMDKMDS
jgi:hypothetical protein